ncbi:MAG TPA: methyltransferase domain-containing protein [Solirubrobacteraceae bacterium]|nr:methyltransferase domain-containing protein [Solirubrobacteraceae bacterium]
MLESSALRTLERVGPSQLVLDVGGWARPFPRADWVIDLQPYDTRGLYDYDRDSAQERFSARTWVVRDICDREPWPFADHQFDFAVCAHTLEDVRDPVWACSEIVRVARAGYLEVPSRLEEQSLGVDQGAGVAAAAFAGWSHHRWLCDVDDRGVQFVHKPHFLHARAGLHFPADFQAGLSERERVACLWWEGGFEFGERIFIDGAELDAYLGAVVAERLGARGPGAPGRSLGQRARRALGRVRGG